MQRLTKLKTGKFLALVEKELSVIQIIAETTDLATL
jgi:hypothetical protein